MLVNNVLSGGSQLESRRRLLHLYQPEFHLSVSGTSCIQCAICQESDTNTQRLSAEGVA